MPYSSPATVSDGNVAPASWGNSVKAAADFLANPPSCRVYNSANISIATSVAAVLTFDAERYDTDSMHSTSVNAGRITFNTAGLYIVTAGIRFAGHATGVREIYLRKNGASYISIVGIVAGDANPRVMNLTTIYKFAAADYVELQALQTSGLNLNVEAVTEYSPEFAATWIGTG